MQQRLVGVRNCLTEFKCRSSLLRSLSHKRLWERRGSFVFLSWVLYGHDFKKRIQLECFEHSESKYFTSIPSGICLVSSQIQKILSLWFRHWSTVSQLEMLQIVGHFFTQRTQLSLLFKYPPTLVTLFLFLMMLATSHEIKLRWFSPHIDRTQDDKCQPFWPLFDIRIKHRYHTKRHTINCRYPKRNLIGFSGDNLWSLMTSPYSLLTQPKSLSGKRASVSNIYDPHVVYLCFHIACNQTEFSQPHCQC